MWTTSSKSGEPGWNGREVPCERKAVNPPGIFPTRVRKGILVGGKGETGREGRGSACLFVLSSSSSRSSSSRVFVPFRNVVSNLCREGCVGVGWGVSVGRYGALLLVKWQ